MTQPLHFRDCLPYPGALTAEDTAWLSHVRDVVQPEQLAVRLGDSELEGEPVVSCDFDGQWRAGRYIGHIDVSGRRLVISPRLGLPVIESWLNHALNILAVPSSATLTESEAFIARLLARIWCAAIDRAARHGPPAFRADRLHEGVFVRGRFAVPETVTLKGRGVPKLASVTRDRIIENPVSRALVAAERVLSQQIGDREWRTRRVRELLPQLVAAVGSRPRLPRLGELRTVRYTPITEPYRKVAQLSYRIARAGGFAASDEAGSADGLLIDVAELWELFVLACIRDVAAPLEVEHGTRLDAPEALLASISMPSRTLGRIRPDIIVRDPTGRVSTIVDAKYKRLVPSRERPLGVDRGDLYQLSSYIARYETDRVITGGLAYPSDPEDVGISEAEENGPWRTVGGSHVWFRRLPVIRGECQEALRELVKG